MNIKMFVFWMTGSNCPCRSYYWIVQLDNSSVLIQFKLLIHCNVFGNEWMFSIFRPSKPSIDSSIMPLEESLFTWSHHIFLPMISLLFLFRFILLYIRRTKEKGPLINIKHTHISKSGNHPKRHCFG